MKAGRQILATAAAAFGLLSVCAAPRAEATINLEIQVGTLFQSNGTTSVPSGSLAILVADTLDNGFVGTDGPSSAGLLGATLTSNGFLNASDDLIVDVFFASELDTGKYGLSGSGVYTLTGNWTTGDDLAVYWFPALNTEGAIVTSGSSYGFFTSSVVVDGGTIALVTPSDGNTGDSIYYFSTDLGGTTPTSSLTANYTAIPEPAALLLVSLALGGLALRRSRQA